MREYKDNTGAVNGPRRFDIVTHLAITFGLSGRDSVRGDVWFNTVNDWNAKLEYNRRIEAEEILCTQTDQVLSPYKGDGSQRVAWEMSESLLLGGKLTTPLSWSKYQVNHRVSLGWKSIGMSDTFAERHAMIAQYMADQDSNREHQSRFWTQYGDFVNLMREAFPENGTLDDYEHMKRLSETINARLSAIPREEPHIIMRKVTQQEWTLLLKQCNKRRDQQVQSALEGRVYTGTMASVHAMAFHCLFGDRCAISGQPIDMAELTCDPLITVIGYATGNMVPTKRREHNFKKVLTFTGSIEAAYEWHRSKNGQLFGDLIMQKLELDPLSDISYTFYEYIGCMLFASQDQFKAKAYNAQQRREQGATSENV